MHKENSGVVDQPCTNKQIGINGRYQLLRSTQPNAVYSKTYAAWVECRRYHEQRSQDQSLDDWKICWNFNSVRGCPRGDSCNWTHKYYASSGKRVPDMKSKIMRDPETDYKIMKQVQTHLKQLNLETGVRETKFTRVKAGLSKESLEPKNREIGSLPISYDSVAERRQVIEALVSEPKTQQRKALFFKKKNNDQKRWHSAVQNSVKSPVQ